MLWLVLSALVAAAAPPSEQTLVYYNARLALREGEAVESVKLWLLRNAIEARTGVVSPHDADFNSLTWAATGALGLCQDDQRPDTDGAGLWPLGLHNQVVRNLGSRRPPRRSRAFDAFSVGRQQRFVALGDVLTAQELEAARLARGRCLRPRLALAAAGENPLARLSDRAVAARLLRHLLDQARRTLDPQLVKGRAVIEARIFDLDLQLAALAAREARQQARDRASQGRLVGLTREAVGALRRDAPATTLPEEAEAARILAASQGWPVEEWMTLSTERRRFLFDHALDRGGDPATMRALALGILDALVARGEGAEAAEWVARATAGGTAAEREAVWAGERGRRILALDRAAGFRERGVIALDQGIAHLERGDLDESLRALAYALNHAPESRESAVVAALSRRWLSYVASRFELTDALLVTLQTLVPRRDYAVLLEDLMWRAAFRADAASFARGQRNQAGRGALDRRLGLLQPLARGDVGAFTAGLDRGLDRAPGETLRFVDQLVARLEREDGQVRLAQVPTLRQVRRLLVPLSTAAGGAGRRGRTADALLARTQAILEGVGALPAGADAGDRARALAPGAEVFAGAIRVAPSDPVPWPFSATETPAPSVFSPLELTPVEWRGADGQVVFGWTIGG